MGYETNDIQFSDDALGLGRALRLTAPPDLEVNFSQDSDNADITIVEYVSAGTATIDRIDITSNRTIDQLGQLSAPLYFVDATAGDIVITMPSTINNKKKYRFIRIDNSSYSVTFIGALGTERFGGIGASTFLEMFHAEDFDFVTDYLDWFI